MHPESEKECYEARTKSGGICYVLCWRCDTACLHDKIQFAFAAHAGIDKLLGCVGECSKINSRAPCCSILPQRLTQLIDLLVCELPQACEVCEGRASGGVFVEPLFGSTTRSQMLLEPTALGESVRDRLGGFHCGFETEQLSGQRRPFARLGFLRCAPKDARHDFLHSSIVALPPSGEADRSVEALKRLAECGASGRECYLGGAGERWAIIGGEIKGRRSLGS